MPKKNGRLTVPAMSIRDVVEAFKRYDCSEEAREPVLYFVSELTGISVDAILEMMDDIE